MPCCGRLHACCVLLRAVLPCSRLTPAPASSLCCVLFEQPTGFTKPKRIADREDDYKKRRLGRQLSPERNDAFTMGDKTPDARVRTYADVMREQMLQREQANTIQNILDKQKEQQEAGVAEEAAAPAAAGVGQKRRNRWDQSAGEG